MADLLSVADLEAAKKHDTFHSEVITGKVGGLAGGADISASTNAVTGQVQRVLPDILDSILDSYGFNIAEFTFADGGILDGKSTLIPNSPTDSFYYKYIGTSVFPLIVTAGTNPAGNADWQSVLTTDARFLNNSKITVGSIKNLVVPTVTGQSFSVTGFYSGTTVGGGEFIWDASKDKADHNGGTIIAPEAIAAWDGSQVNVATLLNWTGTGAGCWVRVLKGSYVSPEIFGAIKNLDLHASSTTLAINKAISSCSFVSGDGNVFFTDGEISKTSGSILENISIKVSESTANNFYIIRECGDGGGIYNVSIDGSVAQRDGNGFEWCSGILVRDVSNCHGDNIRISNVGSRTGGAITGQFGIQIERSLTAVNDVTNNHYTNLKLNDSSYLCSFAARILTDFQIAPGIQGFECAGNSISNIITTGFSFNVIEIAGPDTNSNNISNVTSYLVDCNDVFDFDHGANNNVFDNCCVKSLRENPSRTQINITGNKETVVGSQALNRSYNNTFVNCGVSGISVPSGVTVRVATDLYGLNTKFVRPYISDVSQSDVAGNLVFIASLTSANVPTQLDNTTVENMSVSFCNWLCNFSGGAGSGYLYNGVKLIGGHATCQRFNETSTLSAHYRGCEVSLSVVILGVTAADALRMPRAVECKLVNSIVDGAAPTSIIYDVGTTFGSNNIIQGNVFKSVSGSSNSAGSFSSDSGTVHAQNAYVNRKTTNNGNARFGTDAAMSIASANLNSSDQAIGNQFFNTEKRFLGIWQGANFLQINARVVGDGSTKTFYQGVLSSGDVGFTMYLTTSNKYISWDGSDFRDFSGSIV